MKIMVIIFLFVCSVCPVSIALDRQRTCFPSEKVCFNYVNNESIELALIAIKKAYKYFISIGYHEKYFLEVIFQKVVTVKTGLGDFFRVYGKLGQYNHIYLTDWNEPWLKQQNAYSLKMNKELYESMIVHEVVHFIAKKIASHKIENTLSEYIAFAVQLSQMQPEIRQKILNMHSLPAFETDEINLDIMMFDPAAFAVKSYLHFKQSKGEYIKKI